jgi:hypothetical protein
MPDACPECGAPIPDGGSCRDNFHALLLKEGEVPGVPGSIIHFYVVGTYVLQHPDSMNSTAEALTGLRAALADSLDGRITVDALLRRVRQGAEKAGRVTRRPGEPGVRWRRGGWPMNVADVLAADADTFADVVTRWARSVRETLDAT